MPIPGAQQPVGEGHKQSPPSSRSGLGALFVCTGLQSREGGGIGLDSRSCSCSPGCLSPCPVSAPDRIKRYCSSPEIVRGALDRLGEPRVFRLTPTQAQMRAVNARVLQRESPKRATGSRLSLREPVGSARRGGNGWTSPLGVSSGSPAGTCQPSSDREENLCNN